MSEYAVLQKRCTGPCGQEYPATTEFFHRNKGTLCSRCKSCKNGAEKIRNSDPEVKKRRSDRGKAYRNGTEGRKRESERKKIYHSRPEVKKHRSVYHKNYHSRPEVQERRKDREKTHRDNPEIQEHRRAYGRVYSSRLIRKNYRKNYNNRLDVQEHRRTVVKAYRNRPEIQDLYRVHARNRYARKKAVAGAYTPEQIQDQLRRQKHRCYYAACGHAKFKKTKDRYVYHIEHTFPVSRVAGSDIPANDIGYLVLTCPACNISKGDKFPWEWPEGGRLL